MCFHLGRQPQAGKSIWTAWSCATPGRRMADNGFGE
jgi:hypothetical protein